MPQKRQGLPIHLSTQFSSQLRNAKLEGLERVKLAREVSMDEIKEMQESGCRNEAFIHRGAMYFYSGRCGISNHGARDANRGGCAQSCR